MWIRPLGLALLLGVGLASYVQGETPAASTRPPRTAFSPEDGYQRIQKEIPPTPVENQWRQGEIGSINPEAEGNTLLPFDRDKYLKQWRSEEGERSLATWRDLPPNYQILLWGGLSIQEQKEHWKRINVHERATLWRLMSPEQKKAFWPLLSAEGKRGLYENLSNQERATSGALLGQDDPLWGEILTSNPEDPSKFTPAKKPGEDYQPKSFFIDEFDESQFE